jgi:hypothetical protein
MFDGTGIDKRCTRLATSCVTLCRQWQIVADCAHVRLESADSTGCYDGGCTRLIWRLALLASRAGVDERCDALQTVLVVVLTSMLEQTAFK